MERFVRGDIVVINFPFSNLSQTKRRPALILKEIARGDLILCQITGRSFEPKEEIIIKDEDFKEGNLYKKSFVRFAKLFTTDEKLISYKICKIKDEKINEIIRNLTKLLLN